MYTKLFSTPYVGAQARSLSVKMSREYAAKWLEKHNITKYQKEEYTTPWKDGQQFTVKITHNERLSD